MDGNSEVDFSQHKFVEIKVELQDGNDGEDFDTQQKSDFQIAPNPLDLDEKAPTEKIKYSVSCKICNKIFKDNYRLKRHYRQVHVKTGEMIESDGTFVLTPNVKLQENISPEQKHKEDYKAICKICNKGRVSQKEW